MSKTHLMLLKENWSKWLRVDDINKIDSIADKINRGNAREYEEGQSQAQRMEESKIKTALNSLFQVVVKKSLDEILDLHVHKDKDPIVEIQFG